VITRNTKTEDITITILGNAKEESGDDPKETDVRIGTIGDAGERVLKGVLERAKAQLMEKQTQLERWNEVDQSNFIEYFGNAKEATRKIIQQRVFGVLKEINDILAKSKIKEIFFLHRFEDDLQARAFINTRHIGLTNKFWLAPGQGGMFSKVTTIVHELSHLYYFNKDGSLLEGTDDFGAYGFKGAKALRDAEVAHLHASAFSYYISNSYNEK
jgi:Lysine-specific metallo-endopeptidase